MSRRGRRGRGDWSRTNETGNHPCAARRRARRYRWAPRESQRRESSPPRADMSRSPSPEDAACRACRATGRTRTLASDVRSVVSHPRDGGMCSSPTCRRTPPGNRTLRRGFWRPSPAPAGAVHVRRAPSPAARVVPPGGLEPPSATFATSCSIRGTGAGVRGRLTAGVRGCGRGTTASGGGVSTSVASAPTRSGSSAVDTRRPPSGRRARRFADSVARVSLP